MVEKQKLIKLLGCIAKSSIGRMPDIIREIPTVGGVLSEGYQAVLDGIQEFKRMEAAADNTTQEKDKINKICYNAMIEEAKKSPKPKYMSCILVPTIDGEVLSQEQKDKLDAIFNLEDDFGKGDALETIEQFMVEYMSDELNLNDDYEIGDNYFSFNLCVEKAPYDEEDADDDEWGGFIYNEEPVQRLIKAVNGMLGQTVFRDYII